MTDLPDITSEPAPAGDLPGEPEPAAPEPADAAPAGKAFTDEEMRAIIELMSPGPNTGLLDVLKRLPYELVLDDVFAGELYSALCNMAWQPTSNANAPLQGAPYEDKDIFTCSWRSAGGIVADLRNQARGKQGVPSRDCIHCGHDFNDHCVVRVQPGESHTPCPDSSGRSFEGDPNRSEDYMDWYCHGQEGYVSERVADTLRAGGWEPDPDYYDDDF